MPMGFDTSVNTWCLNRVRVLLEDKIQQVENSSGWTSIVK